MSDGFRWNDWNIDHIAKHGVEPDEAEYVVDNATRPYPSYEGNGKWLVLGQTSGGRFLHVIFIVDPDDTIYVIHVRNMTDKEKRNLRRRRK